MNDDENETENENETKTEKFFNIDCLDIWADKKNL